MKNLLLILILLSIASCTIPDYSEGGRTGKLTKFSKKGFVCKTWEGSVLQGETNGTTFDFTVRSESLAQELKELQGEEITVLYTENYWTNPCSAETDYIVIGYE